MRILIFLIVLGTAAASCSSRLQAQTVFRTGVYSSSGHTVSDEANVLRGTLGQPVTGATASATALVRSGFWNQVGTGLAPRSVAAPLLVSPPHEAVDVPRDVSLVWGEVEGASYHLQLSTASDFASVLVDTASLAEVSFDLSELEFNTTYFWRVRASIGGITSPFAGPFSFTTVTGVSAEHDELPESFELHQNYPNPFNPTTRIQFALPEPAHVTVMVYNAVGQEVRTVADRPYDAGRHTVVFSAGELPSGVYLYTIRAGDHSAVRRMVLVK